MFDGLDCCGNDINNDGIYDHVYDIAPGDTTFCSDCLCKGIHNLKKNHAYFLKLKIGRLQSK